jgi:formate hydrogenlyase transcriptional activator
MSSVALPVSETAVAGRYEALLRVSQRLTSNRCPNDLFSVLAQELSRVVEFCYLGVGIYDEKAHAVHLKMFDDRGCPIPPPKLAPEETMTWWVYQHQQPLVIPSTEKETRFPAAVELLKEQGIRSMCAVPLTTMHRRVGCLAVGRKQPHAYRGDEISFLSLVAEQVALALDAALNFKASELAQEELKRERDRLQLLLEVTNQVVSSLKLRDLLRVISANIRRVMACDAAGVALPDDDGKHLRVYALDFPESKGLVKEDRLISIDKSPLGRAFQMSEPVLMGPRELSLMGSDESNEAIAEGIKFSCFIPLLSRSHPVGVLALARLGERPFGPEEVGFLAQVGGQVAIAVENARAYRQIADLKDQLAQEKVYLEDEIRSELNFEEIIGESAALRRVLGQVETVAPTDSTVLIYGETGTGKELIARAIHDFSARQSGAFVKLNCAAIPTGLLESELFGHEKGAFTGAVMQRTGRFELAHRGTMFLDEIGEIPLELQPKLLRVLQERDFERLGSVRTLHTDARLIAATNRDLASLVEQQRFREDLFYRLNVFPVHVPALRDRPEDIPLLVRHFTQQFSRRMSRTILSIPTETMNALARYHWPGNVRELQNVIERAVILSRGTVLTVALSDLRRRTPDGNPKPTDTLEEVERKHILAVLQETKWVVGGMNGAAARLGLNRSTLQFRIRRLGLTRPERI